jgi:hypothetical protein
MPFKHNAARRHRIPKTRYRVQNWPAYETGLKRRGDLTLWLDEAALAGWHGRRNLAETAVGRYKAIIGPKLRARILPAQQGETAIATEVLNRMIRVAKPVSIRAP